LVVGRNLALRAPGQTGIILLQGNIGQFTHPCQERLRAVAPRAPSPSYQDLTGPVAALRDATLLHGQGIKNRNFTADFLLLRLAIERGPAPS
jgi:hypothetical protein